MAAGDGPIAVEVVYALPDTQSLIALTVTPGTTARQAIEQSGILQRHPQIDPACRKIGIFGKAAVPDAVLKDGDRIEIYRSLIADPKDARRRRANRKT
jgi:putative ubiquitin-RnfH superfamily antitoxin RatB of RatAB toxin-antitoxin module